jgi:hypothetical protein
LLIKKTDAQRDSSKKQQEERGNLREVEKDKVEKYITTNRIL